MNVESVESPELREMANVLKIAFTISDDAERYDFISKRFPENPDARDRLLRLSQHIIYSDPENLFNLNHIESKLNALDSNFPKFPDFCVLESLESTSDSFFYLAGIDPDSEELLDTDEIFVIRSLKKEINRSDYCYKLFKNEITYGKQIKKYYFKKLIASDFEAEIPKPIIPVLFADLKKKYSVMPYQPGIKLTEFMDGVVEDEEDIDFREIAEIILSISKAIGILHEMNLIYRALNPDNIIIDEDRQCYISGLEYVCSVNPSNKTREEITNQFIINHRKKNCKFDRHSSDIEINEKIPYLSPDLFSSPRSRKKVSPSTDVYSIGVILYTFLTKVFPIQREIKYGAGRNRSLLADMMSAFGDLKQYDDVKTYCEKICVGDILPCDRFNKQIPPDLAAICMACLDKSPEKRYENAQKLAQDIELFLEGKPPELVSKSEKPNSQQNYGKVTSVTPTTLRKKKSSYKRTSAVKISRTPERKKVTTPRRGGI